MRRIGFSLMVLMFSGCFLEALGQTETYAWGNVAIGGGGFVSGIIPSKTQQGLFYARTDVGGAYRWDAVGGKWIPLLDWVSEDETGLLGIESLATDPVNPANLYMLAGTSYFNNGKTAILKSSDYGATFSVIDVTAQFKADGNGMGRQTGEKLQVDPNNPSVIYCGTRASGLFRSLNSGTSWSRVTGLNATTTPNGNGISFVVMDPSSGTAGSATQTLIAGISQTGTNLYRSDNAGNTFTAITGAPVTLMPHRAVLTSQKMLYVTYANAAGPWDISGAGQIWKYNLTTKSWTNVTPAGFSGAFGGISVDPADPLRLVASSVNTYQLQDGSYGDRIFLSTNGGTSWTDVVARGFTLDANGISWITGNAIHWAGCVEFDPFDTKKAWIISGNGVWSTDDIDATQNVWKFRVKGLEETVPFELVSVPNGPVVSAIGDYDGFRTTDVHQYSPIHSPTMGTTTSIAVASLNPQRMLRVGTKMYSSNDEGLTWSECTLSGAKGNVAISADGKIFLHSPEGSSNTYWSDNSGASWTMSKGISLPNTRPIADPINKNKFYAYNGLTGSIMVSNDAGITFESAGIAGTGGSKLVRATPGKEGDLWVALLEGGLTHSLNSGQSFTKVASVSSCAAVGLGKSAPGKNYPTIFIWGTVNGVRGLFRSTDQGASWKRINDDAHEYGGLANGQFVSGDMNVYGRAYTSTAGRGIVFGESDQMCLPEQLVSKIKLGSADIAATQYVKAELSDVITLRAEAPGDGTWSWTGPAGFTAASEEVVLNNLTALQAGMYSLRYKNAAGCESGEAIFVVDVELKAESIAVKGEDNRTTIDEFEGTLQLAAEFLPAATSNQRVDWSITDNPALAAITEGGLLTAHGDGVINVRATATDGSEVFGELTVTLSHQLGPLGLLEPGSVTLYPNPATGQFTIATPAGDFLKLEIIDARGASVYSQYLGSSTEQIINTNLGKGVYICRFASTKATIIRKLIIQ